MASSLLFNRVKVETATTGTGSITLGAALSTYLDFAGGGVSNGNQVSYLIEDGSTGWEIGTGTYTTAGTALSRTPLKSSNSNAAINLSGNAVVSITALSGDIVTPDNAQTLTSKTLTSPIVNTPNLTGGTINNATIGATTPSSGVFSSLTATGGTVNGVSVGATTRSTGAFTTLTANSNATFTGGVGKNAFGTTNFAIILNVNSSATGTGTVVGLGLASEVQSDVTGDFRCVQSGPSVAAGAVVSNVYHFRTSGAVLGAGASISGNQYGYMVENNLTTAAINYGFYSAIPSTGGGTNWAFYHNGTANSAFAGNTRFGGVTAPVATVDVTGTVSATGVITGGSFAGPLNGTVGATTPNTGAFTTVTASTSIRSSGTGGIGYSTGAGIAVTQLTSRTTTTPTTGADPCGAITLFTTTAVVGTYFSFTVPNTNIAVTDTVVLSVRGATNTYIAFVSAITAATSFQITMASVVGTASDTPIVNFAILKSVAA
jgi:hypothetical protein